MLFGQILFWGYMAGTTNVVLSVILFLCGRLQKTFERWFFGSTAVSIAIFLLILWCIINGGKLI